MRKLAIAMALASTALATPAVAEDHSVYVGLEGGVMSVEDVDFNHGSTGLELARGLRSGTIRRATTSTRSPVRFRLHPHRGRAWLQAASIDAVKSRSRLRE